jgi:hypothetical protein
MTTLIVKMVKSYDQIFGGSSLQFFFFFFLVFSFAVKKKLYCYALRVDKLQYVLGWGGEGGEENLFSLSTKSMISEQIKMTISFFELTPKQSILLAY